MTKFEYPTEYPTEYPIPLNHLKIFPFKWKNQISFINDDNIPLENKEKRF